MNTKGPVVMILVILIGLLVAVGCQSTGPTGEKVLLHLNDISPPDGATVSETHSVCLSFLLREGNSLDHTREGWMKLYLDGRNVTGETEGLITLNEPPSGGRFCYGAERPLSPGWHTAKVVYWDVKGVRFEYRWRFQVAE
ncbi:MAG: hypothetical protein CVU38_17800 [Chloroflexi bacterium HGW-Chloroflexi-1]|nr:MAG: hypothetical protein CVU38_17800 [Chloroflexi bacterium HGW-Chloroflexi-1]